MCSCIGVLRDENCRSCLYLLLNLLLELVSFQNNWLDSFLQGLNQKVFTFLEKSTEIHWFLFLAVEN